MVRSEQEKGPALGVPFFASSRVIHFFSLHGQYGRLTLH